MRSRWCLFVLLLCVLSATAACATASMRIVQYVGVPRYPASDPGKIVILHERPRGGEVKLGEVIVDASINPAPDVSVIEAKLRQGGAQLGADAVVLVHDRTHRAGTVVTGPWWGRTATPVEERMVVAVAIKYKTPRE